MKLPNKVYLNKFMIRPGMLHPAEFPPDNPEEEYIRKDVLLEWARKEADKSFNSFAREELGMEAREKGLAFERLIKHIESL